MHLNAKVSPKSRFEILPGGNAEYFANRLTGLHLELLQRPDLFLWIMWRHLWELLALVGATASSGTRHHGSKPPDDLVCLRTLNKMYSDRA